MLFKIFVILFNVYEPLLSHCTIEDLNENMLYWMNEFLRFENHGKSNSIFSLLPCQIIKSSTFKNKLKMPLLLIQNIG